MRFKIDWASLIVGSKSTVFALFYFVFEGNFPSTSPPGGGLIFGGAYTWRDLFSEFYGISSCYFTIEETKLFWSHLTIFTGLQCFRLEAAFRNPSQFSGMF